MGAAEFMNVAYGKTASEAFNRLVDAARYEYGHGGYTGTIAEKEGFVQFKRMPRRDPFKVKDRAFDARPYDKWDAKTKQWVNIQKEKDPAIIQMAEIADNKWGPAVCIELNRNDLKKRGYPAPKRGVKAFLFFGLASE